MATNKAAPLSTTQVAQQWLSDRSHGVKAASNDQIQAIANATGGEIEDVRDAVGVLRDDDARANAAEAQEALDWVRKTKAAGAPTLRGFQTYAAQAEQSRKGLHARLSGHAGIEAAEQVSGYQDVLRFANKHPELPLTTIVASYTVLLESQAIDTPRTGKIERAWYATRDATGFGNTDKAISELEAALKVATTNRIELAPVAKLMAATHDSKIADHAIQVCLTLEDPSKWLAAYAVIYAAEGSAADTNEAFAIMLAARPDLRKDPESLAKAYVAILGAEHDASKDALKAFGILKNWLPSGIDVTNGTRTFLRLRDVVGSREALARTLYVFDKAGVSPRASVLESLTQREVERAVRDTTLKSRLSDVIAELPQRAIGWFEKPGASNDKPTPQTPPSTPANGEVAPSRSGDQLVDESTGDAKAGGRRRRALPQGSAPATTAAGLALYAPGSVYAPGAPETIALFQRAAVLAGVPAAWATSEGLAKILGKESAGGYVGIPNYTYGAGEDLDAWRTIHADLRNGVRKTRSSATGLGQLLLRNVDVYYPAGRAGIGVPEQEAAGMLAYIKDRYGNPDNAWKLYGTRFEGY